MKKGILYLVPTPIGNLGDMTYRAVEVLKSVDLIACEDTRTSQILLKHYDIKNKTISYHKFNENKQTKSLIELLEQGQNLAVITDAGTPAISDPASILVKAAIGQGIQVTCLPGATAFVPALAASGLDTTNFTFTGFLPVKATERKAVLENLAALPHTVILYESSHHIIDTLIELSNYFTDRQCVIARELTKLFETFYRGSLAEIIQMDIDTRGEFVIMLTGKAVQTLSDEELSTVITRYLEQNSNLKDAVKAAVAETGINRNRIYALALKLQKKGKDN